MVLVSAAATCKNATSGYPFSHVPQLRARLLVQPPFHSPNNVDILSTYIPQRLHSTLPPPAAKSQSIKIEPIFPNAVSRKPKIDFKPAPRPTSSVSHAPDGPHSSVAPERAPVPSTQPPATTQTASTPSPSTLGTSQVPGKPPSKIRIAIADVIKATEQGALAPPPADAGKIGKLWHQVQSSFNL